MDALSARILTLARSPPAAPRKGCKGGLRFRYNVYVVGLGSSGFGGTGAWTALDAVP